MKVHVAKRSGEEYVETSEEVIKQVLGPDTTEKSFTYQGVRVFEYDTAEKILAEEEMTVLEKNNPFGEKK